MSQHDFDITTADANTGITVRAAINAALQALASCSSGTTSPGTKYAGQLWFDTTNNRLYLRNAANSAWSLLVQSGVTSGTASSSVSNSGNSASISAYDGEISATVLADSLGNIYLTASAAVTVTGAEISIGDSATQLRIESMTAPATATSAGVAGEVRFDNNYIYRCTATNTWKRAALSTW